MPSSQEDERLADEGGHVLRLLPLREHAARGMVVEEGAVASLGFGASFSESSSLEWRARWVRCTPALEPSPQEDGRFADDGVHVVRLRPRCEHAAHGIVVEEERSPARLGFVLFCSEGSALTSRA